MSYRIPPYANMNAYGINLGVVVATPNTFVAVPSNITAGLLRSFTFQNARELVCLVAGVYSIVYQIAMRAAATGDLMQTCIMVNSTPNFTTALWAVAVAGGSAQTYGGNGLITLAVNDIVQIAITSSTANTPYVDMINVTLEKVN